MSPQRIRSLVENSFYPKQNQIPGTSESTIGAESLKETNILPTVAAQLENWLKPKPDMHRNAQNSLMCIFSK